MNTGNTENISERIDQIILKHGAHRSVEEGMCAMEAVAFLAGEKHSDAPQCACPVIAAVVRGWNDGISDDETRTRVLRPLLPKLIGSRVNSDAVLLRRMYLVIDWEVRTYAPAFLRVGGFEEHAMALESLPEIVDRATLDAAFQVSDAAWNAAENAAKIAAWNAAWNAAENAAENAAKIAAWNAATDVLKPVVESLQTSLLGVIEKALAITA